MSRDEWHDLLDAVQSSNIKWSKMLLQLRKGIPDDVSCKVLHVNPTLQE